MNYEGVAGLDSLLSTFNSLKTLAKVLLFFEIRKEDFEKFSFLQFFM